MKLVDKIKNLFRSRPPTDAEVEARAEMKVIRERAEAASADEQIR